MKVFVICAIGVIALLLYIMPDTYELSSGSHEIGVRNCDECHMDHAVDGSIMVGMSCNDCHKNQVDSHFILPLCKDCHPNHETLSDTDEAHKNIISRARESTILNGGNEACFICHSNTNLQFDIIRPQYIEFDITNVSNNWIIQDLIEGPAISQEITVNKEGISHKWISGSEIQCSSCHPDITGEISAHYPTSYPSSVHPLNAACENCHQKSPFQHVAKQISCNDTGCHTGHTGNLISQISQQPYQYQSNICLGCHSEDHTIINPPESTITHFKVYLEHV